MWRQVERTFSKVTDCSGKAGLAEWETKDSKPLAVKYCGSWDVRRNSQSHRRVGRKVGLERNKQAALFPLWFLPYTHCHKAAKRIALPWWIPKALPPYNLTGAPRQRNMAQMKKQIKTPQKELSNKEIDNLSDAEFKTLVIRMLTAKWRKKWRQHKMK